MTEYFEPETDKIQSLGRKLRDLPPASSAMTKREIVALLAGDIQRALDKGYTLKEIVGHLKSEGLDFHYDTVRHALPRHTKSRSGKNKPSRRASGAERVRVGRRTGGASGDERAAIGRPSGDERVAIGRPSGDEQATIGRPSGDDRATSGRPSGDERARVSIARMHAVAPSDEPGRDAIPPGAFVRRPDLKEL
jgi:hypothetical protein